MKSFYEKRIKPFERTIIAVIVFIVVVLALLFSCPTIDELRAGKIGAIIPLLFVIGIGPYIIKGIFKSNKSATQYPEIKEKYSEEIRECRSIFLVLQQQWMKYACNLSTMGLGKPMPIQSTTINEDTTHEEILLQYSNIQPTQENADILQYCVNFLIKKEELDAKLKELSDLFAAELTEEDVKKFKKGRIAQGIIGIDPYIFNVGGVLFNDPDNKDYSLRIPLTSKNTKMLREKILHQIETEST